MRGSEILSICRGCLSVREAEGGNLLILSATLYKTADDAVGEPCLWIAGWDEEANPVRLAIETLELLRERSGISNEEFLFESIAENTHSKRKTPGLERNSLEARLNRFALAMGMGDWHFTPHQFRKTFARFVTRIDPMAIIALSRQFQHVSVAMTQRYIDTDPDIISEVLEQSVELNLEAIDEIMTASRLAGRKGKEILANNAEYRGEAGLERRRALRESLREDPSFIMLRHSYGDCFYTRDGACLGDDANIGIDACAGCKNALLRRCHKPYWEERLAALLAERVELETLKIDCRTIDAQIRVARQVLSELG
jgi:hypothetical protein